MDNVAFDAFNLPEDQNSVLKSLTHLYLKLIKSTYFQPRHRLCFYILALGLASVTTAFFEAAVQSKNPASVCKEEQGGGTCKRRPQLEEHVFPSFSLYPFFLRLFQKTLWRSWTHTSAWFYLSPLRCSAHRHQCSSSCCGMTNCKTEYLRGWNTGREEMQLNIFILWLNYYSVLIKPLEWHIWKLV